MLNVQEIIYQLNIIIVMIKMEIKLTVLLKTAKFLNVYNKMNNIQKDQYAYNNLLMEPIFFKINKNIVNSWHRIILS